MKEVEEIILLPKYLNKFKECAMSAFGVNIHPDGNYFNI